MSTSSSSSQAASPSYRWYSPVPVHTDLLFWGVKPPLPWPAEDDGKLVAGQDFPFNKLLKGIKRLREAGTEWDEEWDLVAEFMERGGELEQALVAGEMEKVLRILDDLEGLRPGTPYCPFNRAFALRTLNDVEGALEALMEATEREPNLEYVWMRRGQVHEELNQTKEAIACYQKALALLPRHREALQALVRLGAMVGLTLCDQTGREETRFFTPEDFAKEMAGQLALAKPDSLQVRSLLETSLKQKHGEVALMAAERLLEGEPEDRLDVLIMKADALRLLRRFEEAQALLEEVFEEDDTLAEGYYVLAWCHFDQGENSAGWAAIGVVLDLDPNHQKAFQIKFSAGSPKPDPARVEKMSRWAAERGSWRGYWVASVEASSRGDTEAALRCAEAACKLAPQERDALFLYANCLNNAEEGEYTAALVHPRLPEAKGDYTLKFIFAGAMKKLGLVDVAIRTLEESLRETEDMPHDWREDTERFLAQLQGRQAESEIDLEFHPNTDTLRREIWVGADEGPQVPLLRSGVSPPLTRAVRMNPRPGYTGSTGSMQMYHHVKESGLDPLSLGWFQVHEIDFSSADAPMLTVGVTRHRRLEATAKQGERRLPVTWSLFRAPSMENDPSLGKNEDEG